MKRLESILEKREGVAREYHKRLSGNRDLTLPCMEMSQGRISWFVYVVRIGRRFTQEQRDWIWSEMVSRGIGCGRYFAPIHWQPAYKTHAGPRHNLENTESSAARSLALPFFNNLKGAEIDEVCHTLEQLMQAAPQL